MAAVLGLNEPEEDQDQDQDDLMHDQDQDQEFRPNDEVNHPSNDDEDEGDANAMIRQSSEAYNGRDDHNGDDGGEDNDVRDDVHREGYIDNTTGITGKRNKPMTVSTASTTSRTIGEREPSNFSDLTGPIIPSSDSHQSSLAKSYDASHPAAPGIDATFQY